MKDAYGLSASLADLDSMSLATTGAIMQHAESTVPLRLPQLDITALVTSGNEDNPMPLSMETDKMLEAWQIDWRTSTAQLVAPSHKIDIAQQDWQLHGNRIPCCLSFQLMELKPAAANLQWTRLPDTLAIDLQSDPVAEAHVLHKLNDLLWLVPASDPALVKVLPLSAGRASVASESQSMLPGHERTWVVRCPAHEAIDGAPHNCSAIAVCS